jgi:hypothetical protein
MLVTDAVVVYQIFGLNFLAFFALIRVVVTLIIAFFTLRIPFKKNYHWMFLAVSIVIIWHSAIWVYLQTATTAAELPFRVFLLDLAQSRFQALIIFQFVVYFVSRKVSRRMKAVLVAGYAFVIAALWIPDAVDPGFLGKTTWALTVFGWQNGPGTGDTYLRPYGVDLFDTTMAALSVALLVIYYRSQTSELLRGQTKYLIIGILIIFLGLFSTAYSRYIGGTSYPSLQDPIGMVGDFVLLVGLMKKGFYSVTPVSETAPPIPITYPLEEARSYLASDTKQSFEAFTGLVRNGHEGLGITRIFPDQVRKDYGIQTTPIRWLAEAKDRDVIPPSDLLGLSLTIKDFYQRANRPVIILQGVEYLTTINGFNSILRLIHGLSEENATKGGILIIPVLPGSLNTQDEILLKSETTPLPAPLGLK